MAYRKRFSRRRSFKPRHTRRFSKSYGRRRGRSGRRTLVIGQRL